MKISKLTHRAFSLLFTLALTVPAAFGQLAVRGETIWTMTGEPITNGVVLIKDGKIERVGTAAQVQVPAGYRTITAKVVTPGLIDARCDAVCAEIQRLPVRKLAVAHAAPAACAADEIARPVSASSHRIFASGKRSQIVSPLFTGRSGRVETFITLPPTRTVTSTGPVTSGGRRLTASGSIASSASTSRTASTAPRLPAGPSRSRARTARAPPPAS